MTAGQDLPEIDAPAAARSSRLGLAMGAGTAAVVILGLGLLYRSEHREHPPLLAAEPKAVSTAPLEEAQFRALHRYVGTLLPWQEAKIGPQFLSAYVTEVKVRPGDVVSRGQVLAVLEPERAKAQNASTKSQVAGIEARMAALDKEAERIQGLRKKGIVSENEAEKKLAEAMAEHAQLEAAKAQLSGADLELQDSIMRAPFAGEISERSLDPGAFVKPGSSIVSVVDRNTVRVSADAPESDFDALAPGSPVKLRLLATGAQLDGRIARRSPSADPSTRTIHFELDLLNRDRSLPVGTTAELLIQAPTATPALGLPAAAANVRGEKVTVFAILDGKARKTVLSLVGEQEGRLFVSPTLPAGTPVVLEGRELLQDGDPVRARSAAAPSAAPAR